MGIGLTKKKGGFSATVPAMNKGAKKSVAPVGSSKMHPQALQPGGASMLRDSGAKGWSGKC